MTRPAAVSVVLPVYNGERYLAGAIRSVLDQDVSFELIISDDVSRDRTLEIARSFTDPRVTILENTDNRGIFGNLNRAIRATRAAYIQVFSQDDIMLPGFLRSQVEALRRHPDAGLVYDKPTYIDAEGGAIEDFIIDDTPEVISPATYLWISSHFGALPPSISSIMVSRKALETLGPFDESYKVAGDLEFYNRLSERFLIVRNLAQRHAVRSHAQAASAVSTAGPAYLREEVRLASWYRSGLSRGDYAKVIQFRCATRGRYHLAWIARLLRRGQWVRALGELRLMHQIYPLHSTLWRVALAEGGHAPRPLLAPPAA